jgi:hypothetical protein
VVLCALGSCGWSYGPLGCFKEDDKEIPVLKNEQNSYVADKMFMLRRALHH